MAVPIGNLSSLPAGSIEQPVEAVGLGDSSAESGLPQLFAQLFDTSVAQHGDQLLQGSELIEDSTESTDMLAVDPLLLVTNPPLESFPHLAVAPPADDSEPTDPDQIIPIVLPVIGEPEKIVAQGKEAILERVKEQAYVESPQTLKQLTLQSESPEPHTALEETTWTIEENIVVETSIQARDKPTNEHIADIANLVKAAELSTIAVVKDAEETSPTIDPDEPEIQVENTNVQQEDVTDSLEPRMNTDEVVRAKETPPEKQDATLEQSSPQNGKSTDVNMSSIAVKTAQVPQSTVATTNFSWEAEQANEISHQISDSIIRGAKLTTTESHVRLELRIDPPELGPVFVELSESSEGINAKLVFAHQNTMQLVQSQVDSIHSALQGAGVDLLEFNLQHQSHGGSNQSQSTWTDQQIVHDHQRVEHQNDQAPNDYQSSDAPSQRVNLVA